MNPNEIQLENKEYYKCESCGGFHSAEETEVAVIKVIKGKNCPLVKPAVARTVNAPETSVGDITPPVTAVKPRTVIPPGIAGMMYPPGHPQHETLGAKETRKL